MDLKCFSELWQSVVGTDCVRADAKKDEREWIIEINIPGLFQWCSLMNHLRISRNSVEIVDTASGDATQFHNSVDCPLNIQR